MATQTFFLRGEVDIATASRLRCELEERVRFGAGVLVLDCRELTFIDSSGIAAIAHAHRLLAAEGRGLRIVNADHRARRVFDVLGLADVFQVDGSPSAAA